MNSEGFIYFYTDFAFKKLFGTEENKDLLISFLNSLLHNREEIQEITYISMEHTGSEVYSNRAVIDVYCKNKQNECFLVELQKGEKLLFQERSIYHSTFAIRGQAPHGIWNYHLKGIYIIGILNFCFEEKTTSYYHEVKLVDMQTQNVFQDKLTYIYLEMPKFNKTELELETLLDKWLYAIRNLEILTERPQVLHEEVFQHLFEAADIAKFDRKERALYEGSLKAYRDWFSVIETAELRGKQLGL